MTSSAWLAVGAVAASLVGRDLGPAPLVLLATAVGLAASGLRWSGRSRDRPSWIAAATPVALGAVAIALRLAAAGSAEPASLTTLPAGSGPWAGAVIAVAPPRDGRQAATIRLAIDGPGAREAGRILAVAATLPRFPAVEPGDVVRVSGRIEAPPEDPYGEYLARIGVDGTLFSRSVERVGRLDDAGARLEGLRRGAGAALAVAVPEPEAGLAAGIVIGLRDQVDRDLAADFTTVGASHVVAISGWNIAIVAATVAAIAGRLGRRRRALVLIITVVAYVLFAGASPSVVRAAVMAGVVLVARETGRAGRATAALGWAAALLLLVDPALIADPGFQLSTLATGGILAWATAWTERIGGLASGRVPAWLAESLAVSLAAQVATLPVVLATFGRLALVSPVVNLAIVPLVAPAMAASLAAMAGGAIALGGGPAILATLAGLPAWGLLTAMCSVIRAAAGLPVASVSLGAPWTIVVGGAAGLAILVLPVVRRWARRGWPRRSRPPTVRPRAPRSTQAAPQRAASSSRLPHAAFVALVVATAAFGLAFAHRADGTTRITVLDVGQGDAILVEGGRGGRLLVDGGPDPDRLLIELDRRLPPWDRRIDILILTHPHEDHVAGMPLLLERYRIGRIYETGMRGPGPGYAAFARDLATRGSPPHGTLATGARITLDDIRLRVLWPDPGRVPREPPDAGRGINDVSVVLLGEVAGRRFLLTGDVEDDVDPLLAARGLPAVDILKVAHHGSATASTPAFLDRVRPTIAIVSAGAGNPYGHPARSTIDRLAGTGARVLRTDADGSVAVTIADAGQIAVATTGARRAAALPIAVAAELVLARSVVPVGGSADAGTGAHGPARSALLVPRVAFACGIPSSG
jgi:competence protein ComEC